MFGVPLHAERKARRARNGNGLDGVVVGDAFDDKGELIKESLQAVLKQYIDAYAAFVAKHHK